MVVIIATHLDSLSENLIAQTILPVFYKQGCDPAMMGSQFSPRLAVECSGVLKRRGIDGVMLFGFTGITEEMLAHWRSSLVLLTRDTKGFASVCYDDKGVIKILM